MKRSGNGDSEKRGEENHISKKRRAVETERKRGGGGAGGAGRGLCVGLKCREGGAELKKDYGTAR